MTREEKAVVIEDLTGKFKETTNFYVTDASGLTVAQINDFRRLCYERGVEYKVYKNTLIKKALDNQETDFTELDSILKGSSGVIFSPENGNLPAKMLKEFYKKGNEKPLLKGASIDTDVFIGADQLDALSKLKSKNELIGEVIGLLQSPAKTVVSQLQSGGDKIAGIVKTLSERTEE